MNYKVRRSNRKTIGLEITDEGLLVRAPLRASARDIESVIEKHQDWIRKKIAWRDKIRSAACEKGLLSEEDIKQLAENALFAVGGNASQRIRAKNTGDLSRHAGGALLYGGNRRSTDLARGYPHELLGIRIVYAVPQGGNAPVFNIAVGERADAYCGIPHP